MREILLIASNYTLFTLLLCWLSSAQASLWLHIFGYTPAPYLWLIVINYWALNRGLIEALIMTYLATYALVTMSGIPMNMAFAVNTSILGLVLLMRNRVLWSGPNSFMLSCGVSAIALPLFTFLWSHILEPRPVLDFNFFDFLVRSLLTAAFALPLFYFFMWLDKITMKSVSKESDPGII